MEIKNTESGSAWVAQSVKVERPTSTQVMISRFVSSSPASGSALTEPGACFGFGVSLSLCPSPARALSLSLSNIKENI